MWESRVRSKHKRSKKKTLGDFQKDAEDTSHYPLQGKPLKAFKVDWVGNIKTKGF